VLAVAALRIGNLPEFMKKSLWATLRILTRTVLVVTGIGLLGITGLALISAFFKIGFGGFFQRMEGWQVVAGSLIAVGIAVGCLRYKPNFGQIKSERIESKNGNPTDSSK